MTEKSTIFKNVPMIVKSLFNGSTLNKRASLRLEKYDLQDLLPVLYSLESLGRIETDSSDLSM